MNKPVGEKLAYSVPEAAEALTCSVPHVWRLIAAGKLRSTKVGRRTIVPATALRAFVEGQHDKFAASPAPTDEPAKPAPTDAERAALIDLAKGYAANPDMVNPPSPEQMAALLAMLGER